MWPFRKNKNPVFETWPIVRSRPGGKKTHGRAISLFINNMQCHLTTVDVYEDGAIDCWGFVDRALFQTKLVRWVVPAPKTDQSLSVHNFSGAGISDGKWLHTSSDIASAVDAIIRSLNPRMRGLIDMQGSDVMVVGKVRTAKMGLSDKKAYRVADATGAEILADNAPVLHLTDQGLALTRLFIFADGLLRIGSHGDLFPLADLPSRYATGEIRSQAPAGSLVHLPGLGEFRPAGAFGHVSDHDRMGEIHDMLDRLNGGPGAVRTCAQLFEAYTRTPTPEGKDALRAAYEAVPEHLRPYCGDMDTRDHDIRRVLYGDLPPASLKGRRST